MRSPDVDLAVLTRMMQAAHTDGAVVNDGREDAPDAVPDIRSELGVP